MAHSQIFKEYLKRRLKEDLRKFNISKIDDEYEVSIFNYSSIFWDFKVDLRTRNIRIVLEMETGRQDPVNNLIKTLIWLDENSPNNPFILLHFFDSTTYSGAMTFADEICKKLWGFIDRNYKRKLVYSVYLIENLSRVSASKRKTKKLLPICRRISQITKRVVDKAIKKIEEKQK